MDEIQIIEQFMGMIRPWTKTMLLASARPMGFTIFFAAFARAQLSSGVLRMTFALALAMPVAATAGTGMPAGPLDHPFAILAGKELMIGGIIGLLATVPIAIAGAAGTIIDGYRASFIGLPEPAGGTITEFAQFFQATAIWLFAIAGGFWIVADTIYASYSIWPLHTLTPVISDAGAELIMGLGGKIMLAGIALGGPLMAILFASDLIFLISSKLAKRINVIFLLFSAKSQLALFFLPVFVVILVQSVRTHLGELDGLVEMLKVIAGQK